MICFGNVPLGSVLPIPFASYASATGASITLTGLAVTDIEVYKGTSVTQRSSDAGYALIDTDGIDIDGITGIHGFSIDTGDNTDAGFFVAGSFYSVIVSAVTVDSQTVNFVAATFRLLAAENTAGVQAVDTVRISGTTQTARDVGANVDTTTSSRMATYTQPTGFLATSFHATGVASAGAMTSSLAILNHLETMIVDPGSGSYVFRSNTGETILGTPGENGIASAILNFANGVETGLTVKEALRLISASAAGKLSGAATTSVVVRNAVADSKNRISATVDADGNRSAITYDLT